MTETTTPTPTPQELRVTADALEAAEWYATAAQIRSAASALDAKGETPQQVYASQASRYHSELLRRDIECSECRARAFAEPAAPPLAPSSEEVDHEPTCGIYVQERMWRNGISGASFSCTCGAEDEPASAPREPQPSSEAGHVVEMVEGCQDALQHTERTK